MTVVSKKSTFIRFVPAQALMGRQRSAEFLQGSQYFVGVPGFGRRQSTAFATNLDIVALVQAEFAHDVVGQKNR